VSEANVELIKDLYAHFEAGDEEGALALLDGSMEVHDRPEVPDPQVYRGRDGVRQAVQGSRDTFEELNFVTEEFLDAGEDQVVVVFRFQGVGRGSGIEIDEQLAHRWTIRDGKPVRLHVHSTREQALEAASVR
jgi:ketosteroid isomerase-like protein